MIPTAWWFATLDIFEDLPATIARLADHLGLPAPGADAEAAVRAHLDTGLRHHDAAASAPEIESPLLDLARVIWNDGNVDLGAVPAIVADLIARGWLRPPLDGELLARARADVVEGARDAPQDERPGRDARSATRRARTLNERS